MADPSSLDIISSDIVISPSESNQSTSARLIFEQAEVEIDGSNSSSASNDDSRSTNSASPHRKPKKVRKATQPGQQSLILQMHHDDRSRRQIARKVGVSAKTVKKILTDAGVADTPTKRGRKSVLTSREEDGVVKFLLALDKVNLNWTWPLLQKLLLIIGKKKQLEVSGAKKMFSSKWLVGFTQRHRKQISLRVVDYGLSVSMQNKQKTHPGRMENFEEMVKHLYQDLGVPDTHENALEVQDMWVNHVESPKTRKVFALKGRKNVRLTFGLPALDIGKKRVRKPKLSNSQPTASPIVTVPLQQTVMLIPSDSVYRSPPPAPVNAEALQLAMNAFLVAGYSEDNAKRILRDLNVPIV